MHVLSALDIFAVIWFLAAWIAYMWLVEYSPWRNQCLSSHVDRHRLAWMKAMVSREMRMIDTNIMAGLQNGTAFFASASLLAIGAGFALLGATDQVLELFRDLPMGITTTRAAYEMKVLGLILLYIYAFFKFGWSYRLVNYTSILIGAAPPVEESDTARADAAANRAARLGQLAGVHFNRGLRAFFFAPALLCWFIGAWVFLGATTCVFLVQIRRQFASNSYAALRENDDATAEQSV